MRIALDCTTEVACVAICALRVLQHPHEEAKLAQHACLAWAFGRDVSFCELPHRYRRMQSLDERIRVAVQDVPLKPRIVRLVVETEVKVLNAEAAVFNLNFAVRARDVSRVQLLNRSLWDLEFNEQTLKRRCDVRTSLRRLRSLRKRGSALVVTVATTLRLPLYSFGSPPDHPNSWGFSTVYSDCGIFAGGGYDKWRGRNVGVQDEAKSSE